MTYKYIEKIILHIEKLKINIFRKKLEKNNTSVNTIINFNATKRKILNKILVKSY